MSETAVDTVGDWVFVSSDSRKQVNSIRKLWEDHPNEVRMFALPENNGGCIYAALPKDWVRFAPPKKRAISEEERIVLAERMKKAREKKHGQENTSGD